MKIEYEAVVVGSTGNVAWTKRLTVSGKNMTIREALEEVEGAMREGYYSIKSIIKQPPVR